MTLFLDARRPSSVGGREILPIGGHRFPAGPHESSLSVPGTRRNGGPPAGVCAGPGRLVVGRVVAEGSTGLVVVLRFQAAVVYSLMSPPQVGRRWIGSAAPIAATSSPAGARCLSERSSSSWRTLRTHRSAKAFARGAPGGVVIAYPPTTANTSSKLRVY